MRLLILASWLCVEAGLAQYSQQTTPVPILKQINRHNEDGSYSYGYEAADGSYKIESKYPTGEVYGKYGFVDDTGSLREVEYGASRRGFEPTGTGINVPPPTLHGNGIGGGREEPDDDGQYREDPSVYYTDPRYTNGERYDPLPKSYPLQKHRLQQRPLALAPHPSKSVAAAYRGPIQQLSQPNYQEYQPQYRTEYQRQYRPVTLQYREFQPQYKPTSNRFAPSAALPPPAPPGLGSYSVNYRR